MQQFDAAVIGGTGVGSRLANLPGKKVLISTPHGPLRALHQTWNGKQVLCVQRHSAGHKTPPHSVNYAAIASGLQIAGVKACFATAATGSLRSDWTPGTLACCTDLIDFTFRNFTMHNRQVVHVDFANAFPAHPLLLDAAQKTGSSVLSPCTYLGGNGPRYESPAEIRMMAEFGGDVVGMTASTEAIALHEIGVDYACLAVVTNLGTGLAQEEIDHSQVVNVMDQKGDEIVALLKAAVALV